MFSIKGKEILKGVNLEVKKGKFMLSWGQTGPEKALWLP
jgi:Fe-S cluster assembly ATPase SufC